MRRMHSHSSLEELLKVVNAELSRAADWFYDNKFTLYLDKTNYKLYTNKIS